MKQACIEGALLLTLKNTNGDVQGKIGPRLLFGLKNSVDLRQFGVEFLLLCLLSCHFTWLYMFCYYGVPYGLSMTVDVQKHHVYHVFGFCTQKLGVSFEVVRHFFPAVECVSIPISFFCSIVYLARIFTFSRPTS